MCKVRTLLDKKARRLNKWRALEKLYNLPRMYSWYWEPMDSLKSHRELELQMWKEDPIRYFGHKDKTRFLNMYKNTLKEYLGKGPKLI